MTRMVFASTRKLRYSQWRSFLLPTQMGEKGHSINHSDGGCAFKSVSGAWGQWSDRDEKDCCCCWAVDCNPISLRRCEPGKYVPRPWIHKGNLHIQPFQQSRQKDSKNDVEDCLREPQKQSGGSHPYVSAVVRCLSRLPNAIPGRDQAKNANKGHQDSLPI